jgi:hypothetical protein
LDAQEVDPLHGRISYRSRGQGGAVTGRARGGGITRAFRTVNAVSPPAYTSKPPVILPGVRPGERTQTSVAAVSVPAGSILVIRASGKVEFNVATTGGVAPVAEDQRPQAPSRTDERRFVITERGTAQVHGLSEEDLVYAFNAIPDRPPTIELTKDPGQLPSAWASGGTGMYAARWVEPSSHRTVQPDHFVAFFVDQMFLCPAADILFLTEHNNLARARHFI